ncbi:MAG: hypothetical protein ACI8XV_003165, partial [Arenicella sp.]
MTITPFDFPDRYNLFVERTELFFYFLSWCVSMPKAMADSTAII